MPFRKSTVGVVDPTVGASGTTGFYRFGSGNTAFPRDFSRRKINGCEWIENPYNTLAAETYGE
jgi:hypothetical protein